MLLKCPYYTKYNSNSSFNYTFHRRKKKRATKISTEPLDRSQITKVILRKNKSEHLLISNYTQSYNNQNNRA